MIKNKLGLMVVALYSMLVIYKISAVGFSEALSFIFISSQVVWGFLLYQARKEIKKLKNFLKSCTSF
jgi:hypothetical protein